MYLLLLSLSLILNCIATLVGTLNLKFSKRACFHHFLLIFCRFQQVFFFDGKTSCLKCQKAFLHHFSFPKYITMDVLLGQNPKLPQFCCYSNHELNSISYELLKLKTQARKLEKMMSFWPMWRVNVAFTRMLIWQ